MIPAFALALSAAVLAADGPLTPMVRGGGDPGRGLLVNCRRGSRPFDPPDPARPTVVFVHGFNPLPRVVHFGMAERFGEALERRGGPALNVLGWDWNAATFTSLDPRVNTRAAVHQGHALASSLLRAGVDPARTHLIGHSAGGIVAASAARVFANGLGRPAAQLTLLDPASHYHQVIFDHLAAGALAPVVENYWSPGPSAYGRAVSRPGIRDIRVDGPSSYLGVVRPLRSDHLQIVLWYLATVEDPGRPYGFNTSPLASVRIR